VAAAGRLAGKVAVVTGGARGIGRATVEKMLREGARVTFLENDADAGAAALGELSAAWPEVAFVPADVTVEADVARGLRDVIARCGTVDVLVNNAGTNTYFDAITMTETEWDQVFAVDLKGAWLCCKHALPAMKAQGRGSIVNISSIHATLTIPGMFPYAAAKSGMVGLTRSLALDYAPLGIRVNAVLPGWTRTRQVEGWFERQPDPKAAEQHVNDVHPLRRIATPDEVANLIAFVASDEASAITGSSLAVDCGLGIQFAT
jgi:NAD(P)-dependent dehydrogenase (short-subunit alcohol dehydrogenase family)